jgi:hypothetical protein
MANVVSETTNCNSCHLGHCARSVLRIGQDKGGVGKTLVSRGLAEVVPGAPLFEIDSSPRMIELGKRVRFFQMRADREAIELTGGAASRAEFDQVIDAIASATLPLVDIGANTGAREIVSWKCKR